MRVTTRRMISLSSAIRMRMWRNQTDPGEGDDKCLSIALCRSLDCTFRIRFESDIKLCARPQSNLLPELGAHRYFIVSHAQLFAGSMSIAHLAVAQPACPNSVGASPPGSLCMGPLYFAPASNNR